MGGTEKQLLSSPPLCSFTSDSPSDRSFPRTPDLFNIVRMKFTPWTISVPRGPCLSHLSPNFCQEGPQHHVSGYSLQVPAEGANEVSRATAGMLGQQRRSAVLSQPTAAPEMQGLGKGWAAGPVCMQWWRNSTGGAAQEKNHELCSLMTSLHVSAPATFASYKP